MCEVHTGEVIVKRKRLILVATSLATVLIVMGVAAGLLSFMQNQVANPPNTVRPTTAIAADVKEETKEQDAARRLLHFVEANAEKVSITILRDGKKLAGQEENRMMPLASTVKTIIAIEYAKQAVVGKINPDGRVKLISLERFYLPGLDGVLIRRGYRIWRLKGGYRMKLYLYETSPRG